MEKKVVKKAAVKKAAVQKIPSVVMPVNSEINQHQMEAIHPAAIISLMMSRPDIDLDKVERMFVLQREFEQYNAEKAFNAAMSDFRKLCPAVVNDKEVSYVTDKGETYYKFASLAGTIERVKEAMTDCGLSHRWKTGQEGDQIVVTCYLTHALGGHDEVTLKSGRDASGGKNYIQSLKSTVSYLQRITFFAVLGLASGDDGDDGKGSQYDGKCGSMVAESQDITMINEEQINIIRKALESVGRTEDKFLASFQLSSWSEVHADSFKAALARASTPIHGSIKQQEHAQPEDSSLTAAQQEFVDDMEG